MKIIINQDECISCGMCIDICPEFFSYNEEDKSQTITDEIPAKLERKILEAENVCPVSAIQTK
ncbi:MAG: ferredoxin [Oscillospiraceae bacterium]|jgi:ferredoxin|nr:ferredoxin [Oscillospiraceae bacterium]